MKKYPLFVAFALVVLLSSTAGAMEIKDGFMGLTWGMNIHQLEGFEKVKSNALLDFYVNPKDDLSIGEFAVERVTYGFMSGEFYAVYINLQDTAAYAMMTDYIMERYGNPAIQTQGDLKVYKWNVEDVKIKIKRNLKTDERKLAFYYTPLAPFDVQELYEMTEKKKRFEYVPTDQQFVSPGDLRRF